MAPRRCVVKFFFAVPLRYDIFISYAHEDRDFVARLRDWLTAAGFSVWLDEERMRAGGLVEEQINQALLHSENAVFVLSEASRKSPFCRSELRIFSEEPELSTRRKIAVLLSPMSPMQIPAYLGEDLRIPWYDERESDYARFWLLNCDLRGWDRGKREEWEREGRKLCAAKVSRWGRGRLVLSCDRTEQWTTIESHAAKPEHEALFVVGPRGEGHNYFLDTVEECFPEAPERWIRKVVWGPKLPRDRDEFLRALAHTLRSPSNESAALAESLKLWLRDRNLVLVHRPVMAAHLRDQALVLYYNRWLPELLPDPGATHGVLKVIQGVDWSPLPLAAGETKEALAEIRAGAHDRLPVFLLPPLKRITRKHVKIWAEQLPKTLVEEPKELVRDVLEGAHHSADVLAMIVERLYAAEEENA